MDGKEGKRLSGVEFVVTKRTKGLAYLKQLFLAGGYWMNVCQLSPADLERMRASKGFEGRIFEWFNLGLSFSHIQSLENGANYIRAALQILEEYEHSQGNVAMQGLRLLRATPASPGCFDRPVLSSDDSLKPHLWKYHGRIVYQYYHQDAGRFDLDLRQVVVSVCDILMFSYRKFLDESASQKSLFEAILRIDARLKHHFFGYMSREVTKLALTIVDKEFRVLEKSFDAFKMSLQPAERAGTEHESVFVLDDDDDNDDDVSADGDDDVGVSEEEDDWLDMGQ
eukprot:TRINITY_DN1545_c0_g1_i1.p2 TRINITY_DN1545_c0_g1~~TRINITY_DN1545_c0_g1_i1.p2  ORF type:complete len:282 (+),score=87.91 TRINITY_DN1545_c0_g1_i1:1299-2144(+)